MPGKSKKLIKNYEIEMATPECDPNITWYRVHINLEDDISEVLPYLNSQLDSCDYQHNASILLWDCDKKKYAFRPHEITIAPVENREEAMLLADNIVKILNNIWQKRNKIEPDFEGKKPLLNVLDIYKLLPQTNCRECGCSTCMAYAAELRTDPTKLSRCPYLSEQDYLPLIS